MKTLKQVQTWWVQAKDESWAAEFQDAQDAIEILMRHIDSATKRNKQTRAKAVPLRVTLEDFHTISNSRITSTKLVVDKDGKYQPGMLAVVMEFDEQRARFTQRQSLRIITHVWQALPGHDTDCVILALQPVEDAR